MVIAIYTFTDEAEQFYLVYRTEAEAREASEIYGRFLRSSEQQFATPEDKLRWNQLMAANRDLNNQIKAMY